MYNLHNLQTLRRSLHESASLLPGPVHVPVCSFAVLRYPPKNLPRLPQTSHDYPRLPNIPQTLPDPPRPPRPFLGSCSRCSSSC
ncbi:hypothetical protein M431DRAFT_508852, partial [Trichoderma harzianum CBS 226.95]